MKQIEKGTYNSYWKKNQDCKVAIFKGIAEKMK